MDDAGLMIFVFLDRGSIPTAQGCHRCKTAQGLVLGKEASLALKCLYAQLALCLCRTSGMGTHTRYMTGKDLNRLFVCLSRRASAVHADQATLGWWAAVSRVSLMPELASFLALLKTMTTGHDTAG